jgi:hypothetical protein
MASVASTKQVAKQAVVAILLLLQKLGLYLLLSLPVI